MENFVSLILKRSIVISKYGSNKIEYWDIELHIYSDDSKLGSKLMIENYVEKIREIFKHDTMDLHYSHMAGFCEFLAEEVSAVKQDLKLKKVIISPRKDNYKFVWEK